MFIVMGFVLVWESDVDFASRIQAGEYLIFFFFGGGRGRRWKKAAQHSNSELCYKVIYKK